MERWMRGLRNFKCGGWGEWGMECTAVSNGYKMFKLADERWELVMLL